MSQFEYRPQDGVRILWGLTLTGYAGEFDHLDGDFDPMDNLSDIEATIENFEGEYPAHSGARIVRVSGGHGWREYEWSNGKVHRYEWSHGEMDCRCQNCQSPDNDICMVTDDVWQQSKLDGWVCYRCIERAIGRELTPADFPDLPCNDPRQFTHTPELRRRIGRG